MGLRLLSSALVFFISAMILFIVTDTLARLGGKQFLDKLSTAAWDAVQEVQPQWLLVRFYKLQDWRRCHDEPWGAVAISLPAHKRQKFLEELLAFLEAN